MSTVYNLGKINIDLFVTLMRKNTTLFSQETLNALVLDIFRDNWNDAKETDWPAERKYSEWRYEFFTWLKKSSTIQE